MSTGLAGALVVCPVGGDVYHIRHPDGCWLFHRQTGGWQLQETDDQAEDLDAPIGRFDSDQEEISALQTALAYVVQVLAQRQRTASVRGPGLNRRRIDR